MIVCSRAAGRLLLALGMSSTLLGCATTPMGPTVAVMPGPGKSFEAFQSDNALCKSFAGDQVKGQADAANQRAVGTALLTTVLGAGLGAATGAIGGYAGGGAAVGAAAGAGTGTAIGAANSTDAQMNIQQQYDNAFSQCMYAKGELVPGYAPPAPMPQVAGSGGPNPALVRAVQGELVRLSYLQDTPDGVAGGHTRTAIRAYEQANGMAPDGAISNRLLARLQATPTNQTATAKAPANWVAPAGSPASAPAPAAATAASAQAPAAPANWVAPTKTP
jgi:Putative peptidoglycan binding domain